MKGEYSASKDETECPVSGCTDSICCREIVIVSHNEASEAADIHTALFSMAVVLPAASVWQAR